MYMMKEVEGVKYIAELRLCCVCCRMFCINFNDYLWGVKNGMHLYQHVICPPAKPEQLLLERK